VIAALLYPLLFICVLTIANSEWVMVKLYRREGLRVVGDNYWMLLRWMWIFITVLLTIALVWLLKRLTAAPRIAERSFKIRGRLAAAR
jgi:uncharacterized BrkB/YihY/UPF0761 family membrane protein